MNDEYLTRLKIMIDRVKANGVTNPIVLGYMRTDIFDSSIFVKLDETVFGLDCYLTNALPSDTQLMVIDRVDFDRYVSNLKSFNS